MFLLSAKTICHIILSRNFKIYLMKIKQKGNDTNNNDKIQQNIVDAGT